MNDYPIYPSPSDPAEPNIPVVYEKENMTIEYKHLERNLDTKKPLSEKKLNEFGKKNWELVSVLLHQTIAHYYFKRYKSG